MPTFSVVHVLSEFEPAWTGEQGKLDEALLRRWVTSLDESLFWISGPPAMVVAYKELLLQTGIKEEAVRIDKFLGYSS
jgi:NAD(P)H-flavin reductase